MGEKGLKVMGEFNVVALEGGIGLGEGEEVLDLVVEADYEVVLGVSIAGMD